MAGAVLRARGSFLPRVGMKPERVSSSASLGKMGLKPLAKRKLLDDLNLMILFGVSDVI